MRRASVGTPRRLSSEKRPSVSILRRDLPERQQPPPPPQQQQQQQPPQQQDQNTKQTALYQPDQLQNHSSNVSLTQPSENHLWQKLNRYQLTLILLMELVNL